MGEITELLHSARTGDGRALDAVFERVYPLLRQIAGARLRGGAEATLGVTALVHEAYLKLVGAEQLEIASHHHFLACAARAMRQILIDHARARASRRRGGDAVHIEFGGGDLASVTDTDLLDLDAALDRVDEIHPELRKLAEMRLFAGLTLAELAASTGRSLRSVNRDWQRARALLAAHLA
ncbi:MAG: RNA polymerase subunit sigma [Xanthomonadales bacterium]|nr:RNA polymerase subunit sigma [Xanthomonadales bacterium]